jgi:hypothetical protein
MPGCDHASDVLALGDTTSKLSDVPEVDDDDGSP